MINDKDYQLRNGGTLHDERTHNNGSFNEFSISNNGNTFVNRTTSYEPTNMNGNELFIIKVLIIEIVG